MQATVSQVDRAKSAFGMSMSFLLLFWIAFTVMSVIPMIGTLVGAVTFFGSPFTLILSTLGVKAAYAYGLAISAPYPLAGLVMGYAWPVRISGGWLIARVVVIRFALTCVAIWAIGACLAFYVAAHDS